MLRVQRGRIVSIALRDIGVKRLTLTETIRDLMLETPENRHVMVWCKPGEVLSTRRREGWKHKTKTTTAFYIPKLTGIGKSFSKSAAKKTHKKYYDSKEGMV